jgi:hypothetical protein
MKRWFPKRRGIFLCQVTIEAWKPPSDEFFLMKDEYDKGIQPGAIEEMFQRGIYPNSSILLKAITMTPGRLTARC